MSFEAPQPLVLLLLLAVAGYVLLARGTASRRAALGIGDGTIVSADDSLIRASTPRSERLGLVGRCDHLRRVDGAYVPVEQKPGSRRLQQSHILQVGALCMLVEDLYGVRPPHGIVVLADGVRERVAFTDQLERGVMRTMAEMRRILASGEPPGLRWVVAKGRPCGHHPIGWDDEDTPAVGDHARGATE
jgi:CRISPR-associated exonuclease Cas4